MEKQTKQKMKYIERQSKVNAESKDWKSEVVDDGLKSIIDFMTKETRNRRAC